jgi:hypothetical protein
MKYLAIGNNAKTVKSDKQGEYLTAIMYIAPADIVEGINVCPMAEIAGCKEACLYTAGRGAMSNIQAARVRKTEAFRDGMIEFVDQLILDVCEAQRKAYRKDVKLAVRLNGTSDIAWENQVGSGGATLMEIFPQVQFYDYTKLPDRKVPKNYHLTVSYSGKNQKYIDKVLKTNHNIAVVFREKELPEVFLGRKVINGDEDDLRFLDPANSVVGLYAKGKAKKDTSGFVVDNLIELKEVA